MKIVMLNGQNHKGSSYHIGRMIADKVSGDNEIREFFFPKDLLWRSDKSIKWKVPVILSFVNSYFFKIKESTMPYVVGIVLFLHFNTDNKSFLLLKLYL